jgi:hypothetical protein
MLAPITAIFKGTLPVTESVVLPPKGKSIMRRLQRVICSKCQSKMFLGRIQEGPSGYDLRTFECPRCPHQLKMAVRLGDPMQSKATMGWLQGQLAAPT